MLESFVKLSIGLIVLAFVAFGCAFSPAASAPVVVVMSTAAPADPDACNQIAKACHRHDKEAGIIHDCHELGHAQSLDACVARRQQCLEACSDKGH